jgi:hypothetical protein
LDKAKRLQQLRKKRNEELDLADCLQLADKLHIIFESAEAKALLGDALMSPGEETLRSAEDLRNKLAHANDLVGGTTWPELIDLVDAAEDLLKQCERVPPDDALRSV